MRKIEQDVKYINLDVSVDIETNQGKSFDEMNLMINKNCDQISSNADEENFKKNFISREAADIWVKLFKLEHDQSLNDFIDKFSAFVYSTENVLLTRQGSI